MKLFVNIKIFLVMIFTGAVVLFCSCAGYNNLSELSWPEAFDEMHRELSVKYPFNEWKDIDLNAAHEKTSMEVLKAWENSDRDSYYCALREYVFNFHDRHVFIMGEGFDKHEKMIAGSYGLGIIKLNNGKYIAHYIAENGSARKEGVEWGAVITHWNGEEIDSAVAEVSLSVTASPPSTTESWELFQSLIIGRAVIGEKVSIKYINPDTLRSSETILTAGDDRYADFKNSFVCPIFQGGPTISPITYEFISDEIGYIQIKKFMPSLVCINPASNFRRAVKKMIDKDVKTIILDVRGNVGGLDSLVPKFSGHFLESESFYEYVSYYDVKSDSFKINEDETLIVEPDDVYFSGEIIVLVDASSISTAEGIPMIMQKTGRGVVMGQWGTAGAFGCGVSTVFELPENIHLGFSPGRSLDQSKQIQVDSDDTGEGGIRPDILVPLNYENAYARFIEGKDVVLEAAVNYISGK